MLTHIVQKPFRDGDRKVVSGELVNALGWPLAEKLVAQRYLIPIPPGLQPVRSVDGRWWADGQFLQRYGLQEERPAPTPVIITESVVEIDPEPGVEPEAEPNFPQHRGSGWFVLSDGTKVKGKQKATDAEAALVR